MFKREDWKELKTIKDWLRWIYSRFNESDLYYGHGLADAWDESTYLVSHVLCIPWSHLSEFYDCCVTAVEAQQLIQITVRRINEQKPLFYLLNAALFCHHVFYIDERVIVPRSPLADIINNRFSPWLDAKQITHVLDLCCGSGCLGLTIAKVFPNTRVDLLDHSRDALEVAQINVDALDLWDRVNLVLSDLFAALRDPILHTKYQLIISNPPYVPNVEMDTLPREYHYEPRVSLAAGKEGLDIVHRILRDSVHFLDEQGILIVEVGENRTALTQHYPDVPFQWLPVTSALSCIFLLTAEQCKQHFAKNVKSIS